MSWGLGSHGVVSRPFAAEQDIFDDTHFYFFNPINHLQKPATIAVSYFERLLIISANFIKVVNGPTVPDAPGILRRC